MTLPRPAHLGNETINELLPVAGGLDVWLQRRIGFGLLCCLVVRVPFLSYFFDGRQIDVVFPCHTMDAVCLLRIILFWATGQIAGG